MAGRRCGATFIDKAFIELVRARLGKEDWAKIAGPETNSATGDHTTVKPKVRMLEAQFEPIKHQFDGKENNHSWPIQLPSGIGINNSVESGFLNGAIEVTTQVDPCRCSWGLRDVLIPSRDDVKKMFAYSVDNTLVLISQAMTQIEVMETGLKVRVCFTLASTKWY